MLLRKRLFNCYAPLPRDSDQRTEREFLFSTLTLTASPCITLTKGSLHIVHWTHIWFPGDSLCFITWMFNCVRKIKRHSGEKKKTLNVPMDLCHDTKCMKNHSECGSCVRYVLGSFGMPGELRPTGPLSRRLCHCVWQATETVPWKEGLLSLPYSCFDWLPPHLTFTAFHLDCNLQNLLES